MTHVAILGRAFDRPVINLGFSGNGRMEPEVTRFVAEVDAAVACGREAGPMRNRGLERRRKSSTANRPCVHVLLHRAIEPATDRAAAGAAPHRPIETEGRAGRAEHPRLKGFFMANGFSGHGLMMAPATGKVMSELIRTGRAETVDVSDLSIERFARGELFWDEAMI